MNLRFHINNKKAPKKILQGLVLSRLYDLRAIRIGLPKNILNPIHLARCSKNYISSFKNRKQAVDVAQNRT